MNQALSTQTMGWPPASPARLAEMLAFPGETVLLPTEAQSSVIEATEGSLLVVAGAGSGKTRTMAEKVAWIVSQGLARPDEILGVTFTKKAAAELGNRIRAKLHRLDEVRREWDPDYEQGELLEDVEIEVSTYHSYAKRLVSDYGLRLGVESSAQLLGEAEAFVKARNLIDVYGPSMEDIAPQEMEALSSRSLTSLTSSVLQMVSAKAEHGVQWETVRASLRRYLDAVESTMGAKPKKATKDLASVLRQRIVLTVLAEQYEAMKVDEGFVDFGDLIEYAVRLARDFEDVGKAERARFKYVLLDEFQDTSHTQMELFALLFGPRATEHGVEGARGITAVGDPHQSIYGFRGASAGQLASFLQRFSIPGHEASQLNLTQAWRNPHAVLEMANAVATPLNDPLPFVRAPQVYVPALEASETAGPGTIVLGQFAFASLDVPDALEALENLDSDDESAREFAEALRAFPEPRSEATAIVEFIAARRRVPPGERIETMAILARTRSALVPIYERLLEAGIPAELTGIGALLDEPEIVEILAYLRAMSDTTRSDAVVRILTSPKFSLGTADLAAFGDWARHLVTIERSQRGGKTDRALLPEDVEVTEAEDIAESASLVEALDELPRDSSWVSRHGRSISAEGLERLRQASELLKKLRRMPQDDIVDVIQNVEHQIGLDVELASLPGAASHSARRHIESFLEEAAGFVRSSTFATISSFLDWIEAAAAHEDGLKPAEVDVREDVVQLMTVHASKGLEWDVVIVPKLVEGTFPSTRTSRWTQPSGSMLPYDLRGDALNLPEWVPDTDSEKDLEVSHKAFEEDVKESEEREERRLAYVAFTRSKNVLWLSWSGYTDANVNALTPSAYFIEAAEAAEAAALSHRSQVIKFGQPFTPLAGESPLKNPLTKRERSAPWPIDPLGPRREGFERAADAVMAFRRGEGGTGSRTELGQQWADEAELLIGRAREAQRLADEQDSALYLPPVISVSNFVGLVDDTQSTAEQLQRPMPRQPSLSARRGTTFHAFAEEHFQRQAGFDFELPWADSETDEDLGLHELTEKFASSEWAQREAYGVEVLIETRLAGQRIKGRIDAVFQGENGTWELVDWKTGRIPTGRDLEIKSLQLALYRLGWAQLKGVDVEDVSAVFYYVDSGTTLHPSHVSSPAELEAMFRDKVLPSD